MGEWAEEEKPKNETEKGGRKEGKRGGLPQVRENSVSRRDEEGIALQTLLGSQEDGNLEVTVGLRTEDTISYFGKNSSCGVGGPSPSESQSRG